MGTQCCYDFVLCDLGPISVDREGKIKEMISVCGVPQVSILSPLLLNIYRRALGEIIYQFGIRYQISSICR